MRIAFDVSPLSHEPTGIGNYIRESLRALADVAGDEHEVVAFAPTSPEGMRRIPQAVAGMPVTLKLRFLPFAHYWRQAWSRLGRPPVAPSCSISRGPTCAKSFATFSATS